MRRLCEMQTVRAGIVGSRTEWSNRASRGLGDDTATELAAATIEHFTMQLKAIDRTIADRSEHAGTLQQIDGAASALDSEHGIYRDGAKSSLGHLARLAARGTYPHYLAHEEVYDRSPQAPGCEGGYQARLEAARGRPEGCSEAGPRHPFRYPSGGEVCGRGAPPRGCLNARPA